MIIKYIGLIAVAENYGIVIVELCLVHNRVFSCHLCSDHLCDGSHTVYTIPVLLL